jgi:TPR repeat protein
MAILTLLLTVRTADSNYSSTPNTTTSDELTLDQLVQDLSLDPSVDLLKTALDRAGFTRLLPRSTPPTPKEALPKKPTPTPTLRETQWSELHQTKVSELNYFSGQFNGAPSGPPELLNEQIRSLRSAANAESPASLAKMASIMFARDGYVESAEVQQLLATLNERAQLLQPEEVVHLWNALDSSFVPRIVRKAVSNPSFHKTAQSLVSSVENQARLPAGPHSIALGIALKRVSHWKEWNNVERETKPPAWKTVMLAAIEAEVPGAVRAYTCMVRQGETTFDEVTALLASTRDPDDPCQIRLKELLVEQCVWARGPSPNAPQAETVLRELLSIPNWCPGTLYASRLAQLSYGQLYAEPFSDDILKSLQARALQFSKEIAPRGLDKLELARTGELGAMLEVANWCDPLSASGSCTSPVGWIVELNTSEALIWRLRAACEGSAEGAFLVGSMVENGRSVAPNRECAVRWYRLSANRGCVSGMHALAETLDASGRVWTKDDLRWSEQLSNSGDPSMTFKHGLRLVHFGLGGDLFSVSEGASVIERAAERGSLEAMVWLAAWQESNPSSKAQPENHSNSWRLRAAEAGHLPSIVTVLSTSKATCEDIGSLRREAALAEQALQINARTAELAIAAFCERAAACDELTGPTIQLFQSIAQVGNWKAMHWLAETSLSGHRVPRSDAEAYYWLTLAVPHAPRDIQPRIASQRDSVGSQLDPATRSEIQARCREFSPTRDSNNASTPTNPDSPAPSSNL